MPLVFNPVCLAGLWPWGSELGKQRAHFQVELLLSELFSNSLCSINYLYQIPDLISALIKMEPRWSRTARAREKLGREEDGIDSHHRIVLQLRGAQGSSTLHLLFGKLLSLTSASPETGELQTLLEWPERRPAQGWSSGAAQPGLPSPPGQPGQGSACGTAGTV